MIIGYKLVPIARYRRSVAAGNKPPIKPCVRCR
jgi:hypothetical protein